MTACPRCQTANPPAARFCRSCGAPVAASVASAAPGELASTSVTGGMSLSKTFVSRAPITEAPPAALAVSSPAPPPAVEVTDDDASPLRVLLNFPHVLIAGHSTTFEMRLINASAAPLENIQVRFESRGLKEAINRNVRRLAGGQEPRAFVLEIDPSRPGRNLLRCTIRLRTGVRDRSYVGELDIAINDLPENIQNLSINIQDIMSNGGGGANANLGADYGDVHISNLLGTGVLRTLNDLINLDLPERFQPLHLALDYEISERAPAPQPSSGLIAVGDERLLPAGAGGATRTASALSIPPAFLAIHQKGSLLRLTPSPGNDPAVAPLLLVAREKFRLGRSRPDVDFVTWFLPRSTANDAKTKCLSRQHLILTQENEGLSARLPEGDVANVPRATIDGQEISLGQPLALSGRAVVGLGNDYFLDVTPFTASESAGPPIANIEHWTGPAAGLAGTSNRGGCVRLLPLGCGPSVRQAVWMFSEAAFGSSRCNPIILAISGLEEIQGRFFYHRQNFWLEKSVAGGAVEANGIALKMNEIVPLASGQSIRLGDIVYLTEIEG